MARKVAALTLPDTLLRDYVYLAAFVTLLRGHTIQVAVVVVKRCSFPGHTVSGYVKQHLPVTLVNHLGPDCADIPGALRKCRAQLLCCIVFWTVF